MEFGKCLGFLLECRTLVKPLTFPSKIFQIRNVIGLLRWSAFECAEARYSKEPLENLTFEEFLPEPRYVWLTRLLNLTQGPRSVADYSVKFRVLAAESDWNEAALLTFYRGI